LFYLIQRDLNSFTFEVGKQIFIVCFYLTLVQNFNFTLVSLQTNYFRIKKLNFINISESNEHVYFMKNRNEGNNTIKFQAFALNFFAAIRIRELYNLNLIWQFNFRLESVLQPNQFLIILLTSKMVKCYTKTNHLTFLPGLFFLTHSSKFEENIT